MTESVITEFAGSPREPITRLYYYGVNGIRVLDSRNVTRRLYRFDALSNTMTENDPAQPTKVMRRFVFDNYGMLEETFSFGEPPRTFRFEAGGQRIVMREGGDYGAVGKTYSFEESGISETAFGRDGSIERVWIFEPKGDAITIRKGGWYGDVERTLVCQRINASVFREPEAFLQFLMFTEKSAREKDAEIEEQVATIRGEPASRASRYAYTGVLHTASDTGSDARPPAAWPAIHSRGVQDRQPVARPRTNASSIDFIPDADAEPADTSDKSRPTVGSGIAFEERWQHVVDRRQELQAGHSARIPIDERFRSSREEDRTLNPGRSANIPIDERFRGSREEDRTLNPGRSASIPIDERFRGSREEDRTLNPGKSANIPLDERFQNSREEKDELSPARNKQPSLNRRTGRRPGRDL